MNDVINSLVTRNSCRSYKPQHITREEMDAVLAAGLNAPSGMNRQTQIFVAVQDDETVALLRKLNAAVMGSDNDPFYGAPDVIAVLAKKEGTWLYDGSLAMGNLLNAAWALGLGSCWIHRCKEVFAGEEGKALLAKWGITDEVEGIGFCILGYENVPKAKIEPKPGRVFYV